MSKTTQQFATRVLLRLREIASDATPTSVDATHVKDFYFGIFKEIEANDIAWWDEDVIPDEAFEAMVDLVTGRIATDFGLGRPDLEASGMERLRILSAAACDNLPVTSSYF